LSAYIGTTGNVSVSRILTASSGASITYGELSVIYINGQAGFHVSETRPETMCDYNLNNLLSFDDDTKIFYGTMRYG
jgi:hypothetical protein